MIRDPRLRFPLFFLVWLVALTALSNTAFVGSAGGGGISSEFGIRDS